MNSNIPIGSENDPRAPWNEKDTFECTECGAPVDREGDTCSKDCFKASLL